MKRNAKRTLTDLGLDPRNRDVTAELMTSAEDQRNCNEAAHLPPFEFTSRQRLQLTCSSDLNDLSLPGRELSSSVTQRPWIRSSAAIHRNLRSHQSPALVRSSTQCERPKDGDDVYRGKEHSVDCDSFRNQLTIAEKRSPLASEVEDTRFDFFV